MIEEYIEYWGLNRHPFLLAPDSSMMCVAGQHYECLERLKYAIDTSKGGALVVSEDAGLGKTTLLLKLIDDMRERYGEAFRHAFIDHPTLSSSQMISRITAEISGLSVGEDKLKNLAILKDALIEAKEQGGKSIIIVDEGQMLVEAPEILQELRILINLTHQNEYLHTFILSGQRALWHTIKNTPEFWQRLPVRFYFIPLKLEETKQLLLHRLRKAGLEEEKTIFTDDALEIIHRYSRGSPRTIIAIADLSLLVGFTNHADKIGFKEVSKAINAMSGQGESLPYVREEEKKSRGPSLSSILTVDRGTERPRKIADRSPVDLKITPTIETDGKSTYKRGPVILILAALLVILAGTAGYFFGTTTSRLQKIVNEAPRSEATQKPVAEEKERPPEARVPAVQVEETKTAEPVRVEQKIVKVEPKPVVKRPLQERAGLVVAEAGNVRAAPDLDAPRIGVLFEGAIIKIYDEKEDRNGEKWYMTLIYGSKEGWISEKVVEVR